MSDLQQSILFISVTEKEPTEIVKQTLGELPTKCQNSNQCFIWHIDNKCYSADVDVYAVNEKTVFTKELASSVQVVVIYVDPAKEKCLQSVKDQLKTLSACKPQFKIILCDRRTEEVEETELPDWCSKQNFDLLELYPAKDEYYKLKLIDEFQMHKWPKMIPKIKKKTVTMENSDGSLHVDFNELFSQLMDLKLKASSLPHEERRRFAEETVSAYCNAINDDDSS